VDARGGGSGGDTGPRDAAEVGDRVTVAVEELYGADPQAFTERRAELAAAARDAGDRAAAKAIAALRRPTRAAWVVNQLARTDPSAPASLAEMAAALRAAQQAGHGPRLRELSAARGALVDALTNRALSLARVEDPPPALRLEVSQTLTAALADAEVAADFTAGALTRAVQWSGFGVLPAPAGGEGGPGEAADDGAAHDGAGAVPPPRLGVVTGGAGRSGRAKAAQPSAEAAARRQAEEGERLAREAQERAARRREQYQDAERAVASTASAAADVLAAEDRLERLVRELEDRLTRARADLAGARMRARQAEAAERRARQALDRLSSE
jgi:hypothetical protein